MPASQGQACGAELCNGIPDGGAAKGGTDAGATREAARKQVRAGTNREDYGGTQSQRGDGGGLLACGTVETATLPAQLQAIAAPVSVASEDRGGGAPEKRSCWSRRNGGRATREFAAAVPAASAHPGSELGGCRGCPRNCCQGLNTLAEKAVQLRKDPEPAASVRGLQAPTSEELLVPTHRQRELA